MLGLIKYDKLECVLIFDFVYGVNVYVFAVMFVSLFSIINVKTMQFSSIATICFAGRSYDNESYCSN